MKRILNYVRTNPIAILLLALPLALVADLDRAEHKVQR